MIDEPAKYKLVVWQGSTLRKTWTWYQSDALSDPVDLTGATGRSKIRRSFRGDVVASLTVTLGGTAGTVTVELSDEATALLEPWGNQGVWDLEIAWSNGDVDKLLYGPAILKEEATK